MFAKSLLIACSAATVSALKLTSQVSLSSLAGVNISSLSSAELTTLLKATEQVFENVKQVSNVSYLTQAENEARHVQMLANESVAQQLMADDSDYHHEANYLSLMTAQEKKPFAATKPFEPSKQPVPEHQYDESHEPAEGLTLALDDNFWNTTWPGCTSTYQYIHDQGDWGCQSFMAWDDQWLEQVAYRAYYDYYVATGYCSDEYLRSWWNANVIEWRATLRSHLQCAIEPDNNDDDNQDDGNNDNNNNTNNCSDINASQCIWGSEFVNPIKNQGSCGSCYSFSATQILESYAAIRGDGLYNISEQQIVDCGYGNNGGCNGGWPASVMRATADAAYAIMPTEDYEYTASKSTCKTSQKSPSLKIKTDGSVKSVQSGSVTAFKQALMNGPLAVTVDANDKFMGYSSGVLRNCVYGQLNHAVNAVGWTTMNGVEVLKIRNSWGTWWGDEGHIYMAIDAQGAAENNGLGPCGILEYGYYANAMKI